MINLKIKDAYHKSAMLFCFLLVNSALTAQERAPITFGKVEKEDFSIQSPLLNSNTSAVVIADVGSTKFEGNSNGWFSYVFKRQRRVKIIDKKSLELATVAILLYRDGEGEEQADDIEAITYNLENGKVVQTRLTTRDVFKEKFDKNHLYKKFTFPNVQDGSILEYSYTIKSDFIFNLPSWQFQDENYPSLWSEFNVSMPSLLSYMSFFQGLHKFHINKSSKGFQSFSISRRIPGSVTASVLDESLTVSSPLLKQKWVIKDLAPFDGEAFLASPKNYLDKISFQLFKTYDGEKFHDVANNWKTITDQLMNNDDFGKPLVENTGWLDALVSKVVDEGVTGVEAAKKIYYYVQDNFTCTSRYDKYIETSLPDVVKKKSGNVAELNLLLVAMLKRKFTRAFPVLLGTTAYGRNSSEYPELDRLNYVIASLKIDTTAYLLDASVPFLPFGKLPANCLNGNARIISEDTTALTLDPTMHKEASLVQVFVQLDDKNEMAGTYSKRLGLYESMDAKSKMARSPAGFTDEVHKIFPEEFVVNNIKVDSLKEREDGVSIRAAFKIKPTEDADILYFNPMVTEALGNNPFHADERKYPVEMPFITHDTYLLTMEIPKGYKVEEMPKSARISLNVNEGLFEYLIQLVGNSITLKSTLVLNETTFSSEDYQSLRDFFAYVVKKQAEQIVLKKIK